MMMLEISSSSLSMAQTAKSMSQEILSAQNGTATSSKGPVCDTRSQ
jgi:hypothetical protein